MKDQRSQDIYYVVSATLMCVDKLNILFDEHELLKINQSPAPPLFAEEMRFWSRYY